MKKKIQNTATCINCEKQSCIISSYNYKINQHLSLGLSKDFDLWSPSKIRARLGFLVMHTLALAISAVAKAHASFQAVVYCMHYCQH